MKALAILSAAALLVLAGCGGDTKKSPTASPRPTLATTRSIAPTITPLTATPLIVSPPSSATTLPAAAPSAPAPAPAQPAAPRPPTVTAATATASIAATGAASPAGTGAPGSPPPPPPLPSSAAGPGGRDSAGATLPIGELCPLGFPVKGGADRKAYQEKDPEYPTIKPVACFQGKEDAITAGYTLAHS